MISEIIQVQARVKFEMEISFRACSVVQMFSDSGDSSHDLQHPSLVLHVPFEVDGSH